MEFRNTADFKIGETPLLTEGAYDLWVIYHPELGFPTYGIINRETEVIEHLQPNLHNAKNVLKEFNSWLVSTDTSVKELQDIEIDSTPH